MRLGCHSLRRVVRRFWLLALTLPACAAAQAGDRLEIVSGADWRATSDEVIVDSRPLVDCRRATLAKARCLPAAEFLGPHHRLPSERDILWLLGTAGLDGSETVLVVGQDATAREFLAGLLYLAGQRRVRLLQEPIARLLPGNSDAAPGQERGMVRSTVFAAPMRAERLVLKHELLRELQAAPVRIFDGRSEQEYWGARVRGARGGHLPGAMHLPAAALAASAPGPKPPADNAIAYAHDAYDGLAYFARLLASGEGPLRVYAGGWAEWAADGSLPVDAASYPERITEAPLAVSPAPTSGPSPLMPGLAVALGLLAAFLGGWMLSRKRMG